MMEMILFALWYFLPAGVGNMTPILASKFPGLRRWETPLDGGKKWRGKRIFGPNKTVRGLLVGVIAGALVGLLQSKFAADMSQFIYLPSDLYDGLTPVYLGGLLAAGALFGDAVESFFKRQIGVASGHSWFPFDQTDYIIGACVFGAFIHVLSVPQYFWILGIWFVLHLVSSYAGFILRLKKQPI